jgi:DeoR/GlpR family transcriptional regulator of sugar metabolism
MDIFLSVLFDIGLVIVGGVIGFFTTRWSMNKQKKEELIGASKEIKGTAHQIITTLDLVKQHGDILQEILAGMENSQIYSSEQIDKEAFINNPQLDLRLHQKSPEKRILGKYIIRHISNSSCLAIDCGTSTAWAFFEIAQVFKSDLKVITNNTFVPSLFEQPYEYSQLADFWGVQETSSTCHILSGNYYPSYGGILRNQDDSKDYYLEKWKEHHPDTVLMGCTSLTASEGPYARSGANRRFKESLLQYVLENDGTKLFILLEIEKIGKRIGEPCGQEVWEELKSRDNVFIISSFMGSYTDFGQLSMETRAILSEEVRIMINKNSANKILVIDESENAIDLKKHKIPTCSVVRN